MGRTSYSWRMRFPAALVAAGLAAGLLGVGAPGAAASNDVPATSSVSAASDIRKAAVPVPPRKVKKPVAATRTVKARNVPERPMDGQSGRRIVYDKSLMTVWVMDKNDEVVHRFPIVGRWDRPVAGEYSVYSKSERSGNPNSGVTFDHMTRFAYGNDGKTPIGFHSIPIYYDGRMMHGIDQLGLPIATGGCIRMHEDDARTLYEWSKIGDRVVVLASP